MLAGEASWDDPVEAHAEFLREFVRTQSVQTNEVQRSWVLLPCFLRAAELLGVDELDVVELGPSAGLNLVWDRYRYVYTEGEWGPEGSPLRLNGREESLVPARLLARATRVSRRVGIDRTPVDVTTDEGARLLECFLWAGQDERRERLARAIDVVRANPPLLVRGDLADELPSVLEDRADARLPDRGLSVPVRRDALCRARRARGRTRAGRIRHGRQAARAGAGLGHADRALPRRPP